MSPDIVGNASKGVVSAYYQAGVHGDLSAFAPHVPPGLRGASPSYLTWGATQFGAEFRCRRALVGLHETFDFARFYDDGFVADDDQVSALITISVTGQPYTVMASEHWTVHDGDVHSLCSAVHGSAGAARHGTDG